MPYVWGDERRFNSYAAYFKRTFGSRMQKVTINAGFSCPNRDGKISWGGCTFCRNDAFTPSYCASEKSITQQIEEGIEFHRRRYRTAQRYLAYFQSFSNTYAPLECLRECYDEALAHPDVAGIVVGTRPDCVDEEKLDYFAELARDKYVILEYGVESCYDATLKRINRGHDFATAVRAIEMTAERGIHCGAHFILGLPGESDQMLLEQVEKINALPLTTIKFHQLQLFKDTPLAREYDEHPEHFRFWTVEEYIDLFVEIVRRLRPDIVIERFAGEAPPRYHHTQGWGLIRNETLLMMLDKQLEAKGVHQGDIFNIFATKK
ncbi:MAG: TIGR01212 family radical SAM protein [Alistipes sp.]|nr:TIGR01212 family radical SAM protein [Alistipes sp.]